MSDNDWEVAPKASHSSQQVSELRAPRYNFGVLKRKDPYLTRMLKKLNKKKRAEISEQLQSLEVEPHATPQRVAAENIMFVDGALSDKQEMGDLSSGNYDQDDDVVAHLSDYLSRPVLIKTINWPENTSYLDDVNPWYNFFNSDPIKRKLHNYSRLRAKLHLKFVINASPFYYGSMRACYFPLHDERANFINANDQLPFSQVPGVYLEPATMTTAEMILPFLWPGNWLDITADDQMLKMGRLNFVQYANLRSANGVVGAGATIQVYAWAEEVTLMGPTTLAPLQSDEYETKETISAPATAVANVAAKLTSVPVVGDFARATEIGARAVSSIAKLFGYSNPPVIDDVHGYQNKTFHAFSNVETRMPIDKLSIDPKNEVTLSSKVAGIDEPDPLAFSNLLTHESFLQGTNWNGSQSPNTVLWTAAVYPGYAAPLNNFYSTTPAGYVGDMFKLWRGSVTYRFKFIKTRYHTGRVAIMWDPAGSPLASGLDATTTVLTRIVDIQDEDDVEFTVPYKQMTPFCDYTGASASFYSNGPSPSITTVNGRTNGILTMKVLNKLTGPAAGPEIDVLVYVRMGDDFVFAVPDTINPSLSISDPAGVIQSEESVDQQTPTVDQHVASIATGETVASLRPLLHRTSLAYAELSGAPTVGTTAGLFNNGNFFEKWPIGYGFRANAHNWATDGSGTIRSFAYCPNHPIDWILNMFVGVRGSVNWHFNLVSGQDEVRSFSVERGFTDAIINVGDQFRNSFSRQMGLNGPSTLSRDSGVGYATTYSRTAKGQMGMSLTNPTGQPALSVNVPQYQNVRFTPAWFKRRSTDLVNDNFLRETLGVYTTFWNQQTLATGSPWPVIHAYASAGTDFQPIQFLCTPRFWVVPLPNAFDGDPTP